MLKVCKRFYSSPVTGNSNWQTVSHKFNQKIKGTFLEKWAKFWKTVAKDYKEVAINVKQDIKQKPLKAAAYFSASAFVGLCIQFNPDLQSFRSKYVQSANEVGLVPLSLTNPQAVEHLNYIERCFNQQLIRYVNLGIFSIIWVDKFSKECDTYESKCTYLQVPYWGIPSRILDIGFLNVWWITSRKMLDYDINY
ncbi:mitochondrial import inner membrane translocase subunit Tim29 [Anthonomus grandis grandis]|uniref:mitochondrial import inner membrane translocase subunit Tim29 n=1 Tax=Anthonomus grandis grandis TaxID=2921223 RepID=UPI0021659032|nr:mitochondrial import inner membrane translocase subunit Tim29 [Anthonomus grandis grandis]